MQRRGAVDEILERTAAGLKCRSRLGSIAEGYRRETSRRVVFLATLRKSHSSRTLLRFAQPRIPAVMLAS